MHEHVSRRLALLRGSMPYRSEMSFDNEPTVIIDTVLLAVHRLTMLTSSDIAACAPRVPLMRDVRSLSM